jgi:MFS family permease
MGFNTVQILNFQAGFQLCGFVFNIIAMAYVDRVKRNVLITVGLVSCATTIAVEAALQKYYLYSTDRRGLIAAATMIFVFQATYSLFLDGATYFYIAEIWPSHLRSQGYAIGIATLSLTNLVWLQGAPHAFNTIGWKYYLFFVVIPVLGAVVIFFVFPDTLHKPLEEIAAMFGDEDMVVVYQRDLDGAKIMEDPLGELDIRKPPAGSNGSGYLTVAETSNSKECSQEIELTVDA